MEELGKIKKTNKQTNPYSKPGKEQTITTQKKERKVNKRIKQIDSRHITPPIFVFET